MSELATQNKDYGAQGVLPIPLGVYGEILHPVSDDKAIIYPLDSTTDTEYPPYYRNNIDPRYNILRLCCGGEWGSLTFPSISYNSNWTPETDVNILPQDEDESDRGYATRLLANKSKQELCIVEYQKIERVLNFYCDSVEWDGNYATMDRSGDGSVSNPWRNVQYAIFQLRNSCLIYDYTGFYSFTCSTTLCFQNVCLRVKGTVNYRIASYYISSVDGSIYSSSVYGGNRLILTSWDDGSPFEINVTMDNSGSAISMCNCMLFNCQLNITITDPNPSATGYLTIRGVGIAPSYPYTYYNSLCWNCSISITGQSSRSIVSCFGNTTSLLNCSASVSGEFGSMTISDGTYCINMFNDIRILTKGLNYVNTKGWRGVNANYVYNLEVQAAITDFDYDSSFVSSDYASNVTINALTSSSYYCSLLALQYEYAVNCNVNITTTLENTTNNTATLYAMYDKHMNADSYSYYDSIPRILNVYNCHVVVSVDAENYMKDMSITGLSGLATKGCSVSLSSIGGGNVRVCGMKGKSIDNTSISVNVKSTYGDTYGIGAQADAYDSDISVTSVNCNKTACSLSSIYTLSGCHAYALALEGYSATRCKITAIAESLGTYCEGEKNNYSGFWYPTYDLPWGSVAVSVGCYYALECNVDVSAYASYWAQAAAVSNNAIASQVSAVAVSLNYGAAAYGVGSTPVQDNAGTTATASVVVKNFDTGKHIYIIQHPFSDTGYNYYRRMMYVSFYKSFLLAWQVTDSRNTPSTCLVRISGSDDDWDKLILEEHLNMC